MLSPEEAMSVWYHFRMREPLLIRLDEEERKRLEVLAKRWGLTLAGAMRRLIREYEDARNGE